MNAFCASENCDAFIVFRSFPSQENAPENSNQKRSSLKGSDHQQKRTRNSPLGHVNRKGLWCFLAYRVRGRQTGPVELF
jgi:hypothetical protein